MTQINEGIPFLGCLAVFAGLTRGLVTGDDGEISDTTSFSVGDGGLEAESRRSTSTLELKIHNLLHPKKVNKKK